MTLTSEQAAIIEALVESSLDAAEAVWNEHEPVFEVALEMLTADSIAKRAEVAPSRIPNHPFVSSEHSSVAEYVCLVADMRESSKHLMNAISSSKPSYTQMKRVYFETAALLPALDQTIEFENGSVTEYLGDGVLALFAVDKDDRAPDIRRAHRAAQNCVNDTREIVNEALWDRYMLPALNLGIGLGFGDGLVQLIGVPNRMHPKVIGPCVYYATKLSAGNNVVMANEALRKAWPSSKGGKIVFTKKDMRGVSGYVIGQ